MKMKVIVGGIFLQAASMLDMGNFDVTTLLQMLVMNQEVLRVSSMSVCTQNNEETRLRSYCHHLWEWWR